MSIFFKKNGHQNEHGFISPTYARSTCAPPSHRASRSFFVLCFMINPISPWKATLPAIMANLPCKSRDHLYSSINCREWKSHARCTYPTLDTTYIKMARVRRIAKNYSKRVVEIWKKVTWA